MWRKSLHSLSRINNSRKGISHFDALLYHNAKTCGNGISVQALRDSQPFGVGQLAMVLQNKGMKDGCISLRDNMVVARDLLGRFELPHGLQGKWNLVKQTRTAGSRYFGHGIDPQVDRHLLVQLWLADRKMRSFREKWKQKSAKNTDYSERKYDNQSSSQGPFERLFSNSPAAEERVYDNGKRILKQPPSSQSTTGFLNPSSQEEAQVAPLLARSNLLITRDVEWANLVLGFEQENRYAIVDVCYPQSPVGFIREQSNLLARQLLRKRRPFVAYITDAMGNQLFRVRRPFWWVTSSIYAEINGKEIGVVHRRWHLWKRVYDLYLGNKQFAVVENPGLWNWTFTLKDIDGEVLAEIDRNWRGFGFEIFTDAGQYVIRFGNADPGPKIGRAKMIQELDVKRPLTLSERAVTLALAISLDNDYFSIHSGWGLPIFVATE